MAKKLRKIIGLSPAEGWGLVLAYRYLLQVGWKLFVRKEKLGQWLAGGPGQEALRLEGEGVRISRYVRSLDRASRHPWQWARCLQRSVALCLWMDAQGLHPTLRVGVRKAGAAVEAHAWVEYAGHILNDGPVVEKEFALLRQTPEYQRVDVNS